MFFKKEENEILSGASVYTPTTTLLSDSHDEHTYPIEGWYWFDTLDDFIQFLANQNQTDEITMRQCRLALLREGLLEAVDAVIAAKNCMECTIEWEYANVVQRNSPTVAEITSELGWTEQQMNDLFTLARTL